MMKIVHFIFAMQTGGAENMLVDIINQQIKNNRVSLIILNNQINDHLINLIDKNVKVIRLSRKEKSKSLLPIIRLNFYLLSINPTVIHCHHYAAIRIILFKKNVVLTTHTTGIPTIYHSKYRQIFAISEAVKKDIDSNCSTKPKVIYNGINFNQVSLKEDYNFTEFKILQIGRLDHNIKGQHILLGALNHLLNEKRIQNISVDFVGTGTSQNYLNDLTKKYNIEKYVRFLGIKDRKYIYEHIKDYNLLVQPSIFEGFGLTVVEGMAAKVPVLISDIEGPMEIIKNGEYGWIFKAEDELDCANQIETIMKIYNLHNFIQKINEAFDFSSNNFSITTTANKYLSEYCN